MKSAPSVKVFLPAAFILILLGGVGLFALLNYTEPSGGTRWAFFFLGMLTCTGLALPIVAFLNLRFASLPPPTPWVILRQSIWVGVFILTLAWLRIGRVLTFSLGLLLAVGFILIEWLLRLRERSQWKPEEKA